MKAKRRHDLAENDLQKMIVRLPTFWELHGNKILLAVIVVCLGVFVFQWQWSRRSQSLVVSADSLAEARLSLTELGNLGISPTHPEETAAVRAQLIDDIRQAMERVKLNSTDRAQLAELDVEHGDLNWLLAGMPELPGATTRPTLRLDQTPDQSLQNAQQAYQQVLDQYPDQNLAAVSAHFGLAAIYEDQHAWDKAAQEYKAIQNDPTASQGFKDEAKDRLQLLPEIAKPTYVAAATTEPALGK